MAPSPDVPGSGAGGKEPGQDRRAQRIQAPQPVIPAGKSVRVRFEVKADGKAIPSLLNGTGDRQADEAILVTLGRWTWEPAFVDGRKADSVEVFRLSGGEAPVP